MGSMLAPSPCRMPTVALLALVLGLCGAPGAAVADACTAMSKPVGEPRLKGSVDPQEHVRLCRDGYVLSHNADWRVPDWVVERLKPARFIGPADRKKLGDPFKEDENLPGNSRAALRDYKGSGFDRGHMAPAGDMKYAEEAMIESFYLSNMAPQVGIGLNRHIWADLEKLSRQWTCDLKDLIVITGPLPPGTPKRMSHKVGSKTEATEVALPGGFYKIVFDPRRMKAIAFMLPNRKVDTKGRPPEEALKPFIRSINAIEEETGLDFLPELSARDEKRIKALVSPMWVVRGGCAGGAASED